MSRLHRVVFLLLAVAGAWIMVRAGSSEVAVAGQDRAADPDAACQPCHKEIYDHYRATPMSNASGPAAEGFVPGDFQHPASGVRYRVSEQGRTAWLTYERDDPRRLLKGRQQLLYFIGSGRRGRTYLFERRGYWFESPVNWYARKQMWDMAPAFQQAGEAPLALPVDPGCLHCHASNVASSLPEARNKYAGEPFENGGITCETCHGDAGAHMASAGKTRVLDIDRLEPVRRDSICLNCHLEGQAGVNREGKRPEDFRPGDNLFDYSIFFVHRGENGSGGRATSQWEALLKSQCRIRSGDRLTCTSCHDPHQDPAPGQRVEFYRQKCLACHGQGDFAGRHHPEDRDCTGCHMARPPSSDIAHEQVTDHWIRKRVNGERLPLVTTGELATVGGVPAGDRDLGLAYAQMAAGGDQQAGSRALDLLKKAETSANGAPRDHELHSQLGFLEQVRGDSVTAAREYSAALAADQDDTLAAGNLAVIEAQRHRLGVATQLLKQVLARDPSRAEAAINLAVLECGAGEPGPALETLDDLLVFAPDHDRARTMALEIRTGKLACVHR